MSVVICHMRKRVLNDWNVGSAAMQSGTEHDQASHAPLNAEFWFLRDAGAAGTSSLPCPTCVLLRQIMMCVCSVRVVGLISHMICQTKQYSHAVIDTTAGHKVLSFSAHH